MIAGEVENITQNTAADDLMTHTSSISDSKSKLLNNDSQSLESPQKILPSFQNNTVNAPSAEKPVSVKTVMYLSVEEIKRSLL